MKNPYKVEPIIDPISGDVMMYHIIDIRKIDSNSQRREDNGCVICTMNFMIPVSVQLSMADKMCEALNNYITQLENTYGKKM